MTRAAVRDEARREVAARGLTPIAVTHLTRDALGAIDLAALAPVKSLLKRFFSDAPWLANDDDALAALVGPGNGWWRHELDKDFELEFGWRDGRFRIELAPRHLLDDTFAGPVSPETTPNPRTIRFVTPPIHQGPSRWYESAAGVDDPRVARLFSEFDDVANVLVGPDFVAVGLRRPDRWEQLLEPVLYAVAAQFASTAADVERVSAIDAEPTDRSSRSRPEFPHDAASAVEQAWRELRSLRADEPGDLDRILCAASSPESATRQVAARVLVDAEPEVAAQEWGRLLGDTSRGVRRAVVDAMVDVERPALRPLLEQALGDADAWTRWKALRGLVDLGVEPSRASVSRLAEDADFRVRLEATSALRRIEEG